MDYGLEALCGQMIEVDSTQAGPRAEAQVRQHELTCRTCMWIEESPHHLACREDRCDDCPGTALITTLQLEDDCACGCHEEKFRVAR